MARHQRGFPWRRAALIAIQIAIVAGLFWFIFRGMDTQQLLLTLRRADYGYLAIAVVLAFVERTIRPYRLARLLGGRASLFNVTAAQSVSQFVNLILPMRSGEMLLVVMLRNIGRVSASYALSVVTIDRLMDIVCILLMFAFAIVTAPGLPAYVGQAAILLTIASVLVVSSIVLMVIARARAVAIADKVLNRLMGPARAARWRHHVEQIIEGFAVVLDRSRLVPAILATLATWFCATLGAWLVLAAIWPGAPFGAAALAICLGVIGITLVSVPAGIGVIHAAFTLAAISFGASQETGFAFALLCHFLVTAVTVIMGLLGLPLAKQAGITLLRQPGQTPR
jgi:uncharacterized protein (TIRG00374 family)